MEQVLSLLHYLSRWFITNRLTVEDGTYYTVIIGQITIYGILLTFYQFVASNMGNTSYLGINTVEYYLKNSISIINKYVSSIPFLVMMLFEILYKPLISLLGGLLCISILKIMNVIWYLIAIIYFILFCILFFKFKDSILYLKYYSYPENCNELVEKINGLFLKRTKKERKHQMPVNV